MSGRSCPTPPPGAASKQGDSFGKGSEEAIIASEAGNNATVGGALIPMIALGIPGSGQDVLLMAALILHQVTPGPLLITEHPDVFFGIISTYLVANILCFGVMILSIPILRRVVSVPRYLLVPMVLLLCTLGVIATNNRVSDTGVMFAFGLLGLVMSWFRFPLAPFVIGFILGPLAEERLRTAGQHRARRLVEPDPHPPCPWPRSRLSPRWPPSA